MIVCQGCPSIEGMFAVLQEDWSDVYSMSSLKNGSIFQVPKDIVTPPSVSTLAEHVIQSKEWWRNQLQYALTSPEPHVCKVVYACYRWSNSSTLLVDGRTRVLYQRVVEYQLQSNDRGDLSYNIS